MNFEQRVARATEVAAKFGSWAGTVLRLTERAQLAMLLHSRPDIKTVRDQCFRIAGIAT